MSVPLRQPRRSARSVVREFESQLPMARRVIELSTEVAQHEVFCALKTLDDVHVFMAHHVWAVWDFMSLLKSIQSAVAPVTVPWFPAPDPAAARFINEIAAAEEGDDGPDGVPDSHFGIYVKAMREAGADLEPVRRFLNAVDFGFGWETALDIARPPAAAAEFVRNTLALCERPLCERVAAFTLGREELIRSMFEPIAAQLREASGNRRSLRRFIWYLERHLTVDENHHGPLSAALLEQMCLKTAADRDASLGAAEQALEQRLSLWNATLAAIRSQEVGFRSAGGS